MSTGGTSLSRRTPTRRSSTCCATTSDCARRSSAAGSNSAARARCSPTAKRCRRASTPLSAFAGRTIVTLEGLADGERLHAVQQAFLDEEAAQCGYCTAGMIIGAVALLDAPRPHRGGDPRGARPAPLPLRVALACDPRGPPRRRGALVSGLPAALAANPDLDTWVRIDEADTVTVFTGKAELGQGLLSALARIAADELDVALAHAGADRRHRPPARRAHHRREPLDDEQRHRAASGGGRGAGAAARTSGAAARRGEQRARGARRHDQRARRERHLLAARGRAAARAPRERAGGSQAPPSTASSGRATRGAATCARSSTGARASWRTSRPRACCTAGSSGRPPRGRPRARGGGDPGRCSQRQLPRRPRRARGAGGERRRAAARRSRWSAGPPLAGAASPAAWLARSRTRRSSSSTGDRRAPRRRPTTIEWTHAATYTRPYLMHGSLGPSAALAHWDGERLEVASHTQGAFVLRDALALALGLEPTAIRVRHVIGPGCYGHNGADDVALDAALLAIAVPGVPCSSSGRARTSTAGSPTGHPQWSSCERDSTRRGGSATGATTRGARPTAAGRCRAARSTCSPAPSSRRRSTPPPPPFLETEAGIHRNATPIYDLPRTRIVKRLLDDPGPREDHIWP